jgi:two-component system, OmpR family, response regulator
MALNILVLEDEPKVRKFVEKALTAAGMQVDSLETTEELKEYVARLSYDVLVLDRLIGRSDSLSFIDQVRKASPRTKILVLSALGELEDRVTGLNFGADDYLPKPFHVTELVARVRTLARRDSKTDVKNNLQHGDLEIALHSQEVKRSGKAIALTAKEFRLLTLLAQHPNTVFSKAELLDRVWGVNADPGSNVVEVTVNRLRSKVDEGFDLELIHTRRGIGYWFGNKE